jgi:hypothetical protein
MITTLNHMFIIKWQQHVRSSIFSNLFSMTRHSWKPQTVAPGGSGRQMRRPSGRHGRFTGTQAQACIHPCMHACTEARCTIYYAHTQTQAAPAVISVHTDLVLLPRSSSDPY